MKKHTLIILLILTVTQSYAQDSLKTKEIDNIVNGINQSNYQNEKDTLIQDHPEYGLKMTTYITRVVDANQLKKYENFVHTLMIQNGTTREMKSSTTFYYDNNKLIKVEEYLIEGDNKKTVDWYYAEDKPMFNSPQPKKTEERALLLLTMSETMLKQINE